MRVQLTGIGRDDNADALDRRRTWRSCAALPGVKAATVVNQVPFVDSSWNSSARLDKDQKQAPWMPPSTWAGRSVETLGLKLVAGRDFDPDEYIEWSH